MSRRRSTTTVAGAGDGSTLSPTASPEGKFLGAEDDAAELEPQNSTRPQHTIFSSPKSDHITNIRAQTFTKSAPISLDTGLSSSATTSARAPPALVSVPSARQHVENVSSLTDTSMTALTASGTNFKGSGGGNVVPKWLKDACRTLDHHPRDGGVDGEGDSSYSAVSGSVMVTDGGTATGGTPSLLSPYTSFMIPQQRGASATYFPVPTGIYNQLLDETTTPPLGPSFLPVRSVSPNSFAGTSGAAIVVSEETNTSPMSGPSESSGSFTQGAALQQNYSLSRSTNSPSRRAVVRKNAAPPTPTLSSGNIKPSKGTPANNNNINNNRDGGNGSFDQNNNNATNNNNNSSVAADGRGAAPPPLSTISPIQTQLLSSWRLWRTGLLTDEDWNVWMRNVTLILLRNSPLHILRECFPLAQSHYPSLCALFPSAHLAIVHNATATAKQMGDSVNQLQSLMIGATRATKSALKSTISQYRLLQRGQEAFVEAWVKELPDISSFASQREVHQRTKDSNDRRIYMESNEVQRTLATAAGENNGGASVSPEGSGFGRPSAIGLSQQLEQSIRVGGSMILEPLPQQQQHPSSSSGMSPVAATMTAATPESSPVFNRRSVASTPLLRPLSTSSRPQSYQGGASGGGSGVGGGASLQRHASMSFISGGGLRGSVYLDDPLAATTLLSPSASRAASGASQQQQLRPPASPQYGSPVLTWAPFQAAPTTTSTTAQQDTTNTQYPPSSSSKKNLDIKNNSRDKNNNNSMSVIVSHIDDVTSASTIPYEILREIARAAHMIHAASKELLGCEVVGVALVASLATQALSIPLAIRFTEKLVRQGETHHAALLYELYTHHQYHDDAEGLKNVLFSSELLGMNNTHSEEESTPQWLESVDRVEEALAFYLGQLAPVLLEKKTISAAYSNDSPHSPPTASTTTNTKQQQQSHASASTHVSLVPVSALQSSENASFDVFDMFRSGGRSTKPIISSAAANTSSSSRPGDINTSSLSNKPGSPLRTAPGPQADPMRRTRRSASVTFPSATEYLAVSNSSVTQEAFAEGASVVFGGGGKDSGITSPLSLLESDDTHTHYLSLIHISEPTRLLSISYAVFCLKKKKKKTKT
eukprot:TRINITY_DN9374_c0_g2_i4.p1 TRINITY_DN9374_c0_g2~~TRINITY_DN9374_c0_g2_i4.p1  ORF type:complete len:1106 (-),score=213.94 TRINITY_DN9374_c0_g2_i4:112-3429(-)